VKQLEIKIDPEGNFQSIHDDQLNELCNDLGAVSVERASNVEWESGGWTVRSHKDPQRALRLVEGCVIVSNETEAPIQHFETREAAIQSELKNFWALIGSKNND
jgi:hypothetical protein